MSEEKRRVDGPEYTFHCCHLPTGALNESFHIDVKWVDDEPEDGPYFLVSLEGNKRNENTKLWETVWDDSFELPIKHARGLVSFIGFVLNTHGY